MDSDERLKLLEEHVRRLIDVVNHLGNIIIEQKEPKAIEFETVTISGDDEKMFDELRKKGFFLHESKMLRDNFFESNFLVMRRPLLFKWPDKEVGKK